MSGNGIRIGVLTISDLGAIGQRTDTSGDAILDWAAGRGYDVVVRSVVPDEPDRIAGKLARWADSGEVDAILTTGGTGLTARDVTPAATTVGEARQASLRREPIPDCLVLTGGLPEPAAGQRLGLARDRSLSTLGLVEPTEPDPKGLARGLGLTAFLEKRADPAEVVATV